MADARDRALARLVDMLTPAAALGIDCPACTWVKAGDRCTPMERHGGMVAVVCEKRIADAREMLRADLRVLLEG
jgi:hypothetical protein